MEGGVRGLVIVFSAFMVQVLALGNYACVGIYTVHLLEEFDEDHVGVSLVSSIHYAVLLGFGPVTSFLMGLTSARKLCLIGAALVSIGIFCMPLLVYLPAMYLFFGIFAGLGGCLIYLPSHVLSGLYYDKFRSLAVGVATAGQGMGAILMPFVVGILIEKYTWRGSLLILAGIDLHLFIFAMLMVPPPDGIPSEQLLAGDCVQSGHENGTVAHDTNGGSAASTTSAAPCEKQLDSVAEEGLLFDKVETKLTRQASWKDEPHDESHLVLIGQKGKGDNSGNTRRSLKRRVSSASMTPRLERRPSRRMSAYLEGKIHRRQIPEDDISNVFIPSYYSWLPRRSETSIAESSCGTSVNEDAPHSPLRSSSLDVANPSVPAAADKANDEPEKKVSALEEAKKHIAILLNPQFLIYIISTLLWSLTTTLFVVFAPESFVHLGLSEMDAAFLIVFYGVGQFLGCILVSFLGSIVGTRRLPIYMAANILTGILMAQIPWFESFTDIALCLVALGLVYGGILGLYMIVMVDLVGVEDMDIGLGYTMLGSGVGCFTGPPIGGAMFKAYGNYDYAFYMSGAITVVAGLVMGLTYLPGLCSLKASTTVDQEQQPSSKTQT